MIRFAWACKHTDKRHSAKGLCANCYQLARKEVKIRAWACEHVDRPHAAAGLCARCYNQDRVSTGRRAWACEHVDKVHHAKGLCDACYHEEKSVSGKRAWACQHPDRPHASEGMCSSCARRVHLFGPHVLAFLTRTRCDCCGDSLVGRPSHSIHVDHDHVTQAIRGLVCQPCNALLGYAKDDVHRLEAAKRYLQAAP